MQVWDVSRKEPLIALPNCMLIALPHCMQVWDVSRKEPKQLLGARKLGGDALNAKVAQIAISSDGTRVAACLQTQPGGTTKPKPGSPPAPWANDPRLYLQLVEADVLVTHDFGPTARVPSAMYWEASDPKLIGVETRPSAAHAAANAAALNAASLGSTLPSSVPPPPVAPLEVTTLF